jgi:copper chaperone CopZ
MHKKTIFGILTGILFFLTGITQARVSNMTVAVDGMACPFCAYGVEKRLKTVRGVATVAVDMKTGTASLTAKPKVSIHYQEVPKAIKETGFTGGVMKITVRGTIEIEKNSSFLILYDGPPLLLDPGSNKMADRLRDFAKSGELVVLHGVLNRQTDKNWRVTLESIEEVAQ